MYTNKIYTRYNKLYVFVFLTKFFTTLGFGCATILWLKKHNPSFLKNYDCCGTIADYLVARLCSLVKPVISNQNSASWGYFNPFGQNWDLTTYVNTELVEYYIFVYCIFDNISISDIIAPLI